MQKATARFVTIRVHSVPQNVKLDAAGQLSDGKYFLNRVQKIEFD